MSTPNYERRRQEIRTKQLTLQSALRNPKAYLREILKRKRKKLKQKATKRVNKTKSNLDKIWFSQEGGRIKRQKVAKNIIPTTYQYYQ